MRYVSCETQLEVTPLLVEVTLLRSYGRIPNDDSRSSGAVTKALASVLAEGPGARLPHLIPAEGEDPRLFTYEIAVDLLMMDTVETVVYRLRGQSVSGEASPNGKFEFEIGPDGLLEIDIPFRRLDWGDPPPSEEARFLKRIRNRRQVLERRADVLSAADKVRIAQWALSRLTLLIGKLGETAEIRELRDYWERVRG